MGYSFILLAILAFCAAGMDDIKQGAYVSTPDIKALPFRWGTGLGYVEGWDDAKMETLAARAGYDTHRKKLPEKFLDQWGYSIETGDAQHCNDVNITDLVGYLCTPSAAHSSNVTNNPELCPPANLYEPIFLSDGSVNPKNYWAVYVNKTVTIYKKWVRIWEVWNEPDYVTDWRIPGRWTQDPPVAGELPHWNGNIFEYNRLMRITYQVVKKVDPTAWVAVGGLGYTEFLEAMLRYTDNPNNGTVTEEYPSYGGAWFDCLAYHKYPKWGTTDVETKVTYNKKGSDNLAMNFVTLKKNFHHYLSQHGFCQGCKYPEKLYICTETDVSANPNDAVGSPGARRGYILKMALYSMEYNVRQSHWLVLEGDAGDYPQIKGKTFDTVQLRESSLGRITIRDLGLSYMLFDEQETASFRSSLKTEDDSLQCVVLKKNPRTNWPFFPYENHTEPPTKVFAIWRYSDDKEEEDYVQVLMKFGAPVTARRWDGMFLGHSNTTIQLNLNSYPTFVYYDNNTYPGSAATTDPLLFLSLISLLLVAVLF